MEGLPAQPKTLPGRVSSQVWASAGSCVSFRVNTFPSPGQPGHLPPELNFMWTLTDPAVRETEANGPIKAAPPTAFHIQMTCDSIPIWTESKIETKSTSQKEKTASDE